MEKNNNKNPSCARWKLKGFGYQSFSVQAPFGTTFLLTSRHCSSLSQFKTTLTLSQALDTVLVLILLLTSSFFFFFFFWGGGGGGGGGRCREIWRVGGARVCEIVPLCGWVRLRVCTCVGGWGVCVCVRVGGWGVFARVWVGGACLCVRTCGWVGHVCVCVRVGGWGMFVCAYVWTALGARCAIPACLLLRSVNQRLTSLPRPSPV